MAGVRLAETAPVLRLGLADLGFRGRVLPALAGLGRGKVDLKVPPIDRVCGTWQGWRWDRPGGWRVVGASSGPVVGEGILA